MDDLIQQVADNPERMRIGLVPHHESSFVKFDEAHRVAQAVCRINR